MRQRFRDQEAISAPRFDSQAVREVLARASEIEAEPETELLTAAQIETLGAEIGLSPEAVRKALGEKIGSTAVVAEASPAIHKNVLAPLTQEQVKAAYMLNLWYALFSFFFLFGVLKFMHGGTTPRETGTPLAIIAAFGAPIFLAFRSGFLAKRVKVGMVGGLLTTLLVALVSLVAGAIVEGNGSLNGVMVILVLVTLLGAIAGGAGAAARHWWDTLPRQGDR